MSGGSRLPIRNRLMLSKRKKVPKTANLAPLRLSLNQGELFPAKFLLLLVITDLKGVCNFFKSPGLVDMFFGWFGGV
jgi:hypothetical protein